jgi:RHS repeat-associated protein
VLEADGTTVKAKSSYGQSRGFTGYSLDEETGLYYARSRMYSAGLGRFISPNNFGRIIGYSYSVTTQYEKLELVDTKRLRARMPYIESFCLYEGVFASKQGLDPSGQPTFGPVGVSGPIPQPTPLERINAALGQLYDSCTADCGVCKKDQILKQIRDAAERAFQAANSMSCRTGMDNAYSAAINGDTSCVVSGINCAFRPESFVHWAERKKIGPNGPFLRLVRAA